MQVRFRARVLALTILVGEWLLDRLDRLVARASILGNPAFFSRDDFLWSHGLEASWTAIRKELDEILEHTDDLPNFQEISTDQATITDDDRWKTFFLYGFGFRSDANCARCPETARLVAAVPGMQTAMFSILAPAQAHPGAQRPVQGAHPLPPRARRSPSPANGAASASVTRSPRGRKAEA